MNIFTEYSNLCRERGIPFTHEKYVRPYDDTTLFCPAGMQQYKKKFANPEYVKKTIANIQPCIRLNDYDEMGDGTHLLYFNMIGLFSFRDLSLQEAVDFWMIFIKRLGLTLDYVTIHPDKLQEWSYLYEQYPVEIRADPECTWSDGTSNTAYSTEFYIQDIEIGNIVNPGGDCIDAGFGYERLDFLVNGVSLNDRVVIMEETINKIISSGFLPGPNKQGSILRKLIKDYLVLLDGGLTEEKQNYTIIKNEQERQLAQQEKYHRLIKNKRNQDKDAEWWRSTHGIDLNYI